jgi:hypothetical protein
MKPTLLLFTNPRKTEFGAWQFLRASVAHVAPLAFVLMTTLLAAAQEQQPTGKAAERTYAFRTMNGYYLTAENGGGSVVNTDRRELGPWETFTLVQTGPGVFAFRSETGHYLSDSVLNIRRGGNFGRPTRGQPSGVDMPQVTARGGLVANQTTPDASAQFKIMIINPEGPVVALVTSAGKYVTAENSGGMKARNARAMATDRTEIGDWEMFTMIDVEKSKAAK